MDNKQRIPLIPIEQAMVPFHGGEILAARFDDGRVAAGLISLCDFLELSYHGQWQRIHRDEILSEQLLPVLITTPGGPQRADFLTAWGIPSWLTGIQTSRIAPEKRELILTFKREAADVLYRHFFKTGTPQPTPPRPEQTPTSLPELLRAMADHVEQDQRENAARHNETERRMSVLEEAQEGLWATITRYAPVSPGALTADHQRTMHLLLRDHHMISGQPIVVLEEQLAALLGVEGVGHIPEVAWDRLFAWFWQRTLEKD